jgi:Tol biopolymer transport system component/tRNA A-37 threonylcarbamoyl transferase component Bud32
MSSFDHDSDQPHHSDVFDRLKAALADRYRIEHELGSGGMATVYLAEDLKHERKVAVKVLRPELGATLGAERFLQEIKLTARLNHPHILPVHDSGEADGFLFYVMPYVEGETLRQRLDRERQLPLDEAVQIAREVADALSFAHDLGVVHRDIKPENILFEAGHAVVADFGIARALTVAGGERLTETGVYVGTPAYMSPEQGLGEAVDERADIYALGCVLFEMLAGDAPFPGTSAQAILARKAVEPAPSLRVVRDTVPGAVEEVVAKALARVPADRFRRAKGFAEALTASETAAAPVGEAPVPVSGESRWRRRLAYAVPGGAAALVIIWALVGRGDSSGGDEGGSTIRQLTGFVGWESWPSWSPDGSMIAYTHIVRGDADIATLPARGGDPHILTDYSPADEILSRWSPDGSKIAFISDRGAGTNVYWIPPTGGAEHKVAETHIPFLERMGAWGGVLGSNPWSPDGQELLFSRLHETGEIALWKVVLSTGEQTQLTAPSPGIDDKQGSWSFDGKWIAFTRVEKGSDSVWLLPSEGGEATLMVQGAGGPAWFPDNRRLAFSSGRGGAANLWEIDIRTRELRQLTRGVGNDAFAVVAQNGAIAYANWNHQIDLYWVRLDAPEQEPERLTSFTGGNFGPRVSPDGNQVVYYSVRSGNWDLWLLDRTTNQHRQLTDHPANDRLADWSPDGEAIVFMSDRDGPVRLWVVQTETGAVRRLTDHQLPWSSHSAKGGGGPRWSPDGSVIGYLAPEEGSAIWLIDPDGTNRRPSTVRGVFSFGWYRDGQRVVYTRRAPDGSGLVELRAAHLGTGEDVLLRAGAIAEVVVSRDGSALAFLEAVSHFTMELYLLRLTAPTAPSQLPRAAGEPQQITFGDGLSHAHSGGFAPDGSAVVYSRDRDYGDIYVIEPKVNEGAR